MMMNAAVRPPEVAEKGGNISFRLHRGDKR